MDTTETYIKMCSKAAVDLGFDAKAKPLAGDYRVRRSGGAYVSNSGGAYVSNGEVWYTDETPLYRQDQLQKMIDYEWTGDLIRRFFIWGQEEGFQTKSIASMEQLWLAFVMKEKYNKTWDGEAWISIANE